MQANVGGLDKKIRIAAGIITIGAGALMQSWWGALGIVPLATALISWCPAYLPLGISTCKTQNPE
jgi:hypothetical protein